MGFSIDKKASKVVFIINPPADAQTFPPDFYPSLVSWALENCNVYAYILHDLDITEDGVAKRPHVHMYCEFKSCKRVLTHLNSLATWLGYNTNQVSAQVASSNPAGFFQYLIHKNNPEKHQYEANEIISNLEAGEVAAYLDADAGNCSVTFFFSVCQKSRSMTEVIQTLGLDTYLKYRYAIKEIWEDTRKYRFYQK